MPKSRNYYGSTKAKSYAAYKRSKKKKAFGIVEMTAFCFKKGTKKRCLWLRLVCVAWGFRTM